MGKIVRRFPNFQLEGETFDDYDLNQVLSRGSPHHQQRGGRRQFNNYPPGGPSPHRGGRGNNTHRGQHQGGYGQQIPQYQQPHQLHINVQQTDMNLMQPAAYGAPYLFPGTM